jgi:hypothetical protein
MDEKARKELLGKYRRTFSGKDGEAVLEDLKRRCSIARTPFVPGQPDTTAFNNGRQSVFMHIQNMVTSDPDALKDLPTSYQINERKENV